MNDRYGLLADYMTDPDVASIHILGDDLYLNGDMSSMGWSGADEAALRRLAQRLAASVGIRLDDASPFVDARLEDGTRLRAYLGQRGLPTRLRFDKDYPYTIPERVGLGLLSPAAAEFLIEEEG